MTPSDTSKQQLTNRIPCFPSWPGLWFRAFKFLLEQCEQVVPMPPQPPPHRQLERDQFGDQSHPSHPEEDPQGRNTIVPQKVLWRRIHAWGTVRLEKDDLWLVRQKPGGLSVLTACVTVHHVCAWHSWRSGEGVRSSGTDSCEPPGRCRGLTEALHKNSK